MPYVVTLADESAVSNELWLTAEVSPGGALILRNVVGRETDNAPAKVSGAMAIWPHGAWRFCEWEGAPGDG